MRRLEFFGAGFLVLWFFLLVAHMSLIFACAWTFTTALGLRITGLWRQPLGWWLFLFFVACVQLRFEERPETFSYLFLILMIWFADQKKILPLFIIQIVWANNDSYFALGPAVAGIALWNASRNAHHSAITALALALATLINPFGHGVWQSVRLYSYDLPPLSVWPPQWPASLFWQAWLSTVGLVVCNWREKKNRIASALAIGGLFLSAQSARNIPLLFLMGSLLWRDFDFTWRSKKWHWANGVALALAGIALSWSVVTGRYYNWVSSPSAITYGLERSRNPVLPFYFTFRGEHEDFCHAGALGGSGRFRDRDARSAF